MHIYMIMPAHMESERISNAISDYSSSLCSKYRNSIRIIIVTDREGDTAMTASRLTKGKKNFSVMASERREGKGGAIIHTLRMLCGKARLDRSDTVIFVDADDSVKGTQISKLIEQLESGKYDAVIGSRYIKGSKIIGKITMGRYVASRAYNALVRMLFGINLKDTQCGIKLFKAGALCSVLPRLALVDMSFDVNVLYELKVSGATIHEAPITFYQKNEGSKVNLARQSPQMFLTTLGFRISRSRFNALVPVKLKGFIYEIVKGW